MLRRKGKKACESANDDKDDSAAHSTALSPKTRQGGSRSFTRCLESACAIAASAPAVAGLPRWLRAYRGRASARSCCRGEPLIPAHHHAFGNAFLRVPPETRRACPTAFWPHSAGSAGSGRYYADDGPSSFRLRRNGIDAASGSPIIVDLAGAQPALSRMLRGGYNKMRCGSPAMTFIDSTTCGAFGGGRYRQQFSLRGSQTKRAAVPPPLRPSAF